MKKICSILCFMLILFAISRVVELFIMVGLSAEIMEMEMALKSYEQLPELYVQLKPSLFDYIKEICLIVASITMFIFLLIMGEKFDDIVADNKELIRKVKGLESDIKDFEKQIQKHL